MQPDAMIDLAAALKQEWFNRFNRVIDQNGGGPSSNLQCLEMCQAMCCPRVGMRSLPPKEIASPVVVLLPFEMEYLTENIGAPEDVFRRWPIDYVSGLTIEIGMLDLGKPCPFLKNDLMCGIHARNPVDCRTFPLLPSQGLHGDLQWTLAENCPSLRTLNPAFVDRIRDLWADIYPHIPDSWWHLYAFADHWTGWPAHAEF